MRKNQVKRRANPMTGAAALIATVLVAVFPPFFLYFQNAGEAHFREVLFVMIAFLAVGLVLYGLCFLATHSAAKAGIIASLFLLIFLNYAPIEGIIQKAIPSLRYWHIAPIFLALMLHAAWLIKRKLPKELAEIIVSVLALVFGALLLLNGVMAAPAIVKRTSAEREAGRQAEAASTSEAKTMPNFYFILFDEFSTIPFMQKYYDYDNSALLDKLKDLGFNISQTGHNDCYITAVVTANLFQLDYVAEPDENEETLFKLRSDNKVFPLLRNAGYSIISSANADFYGLPDAKSGNTIGTATTVSGDDIKTIVLSNTVLYPLLSRQGNYSERANKILNELEYIKDPTHFSNNEFILSHFELPHEPFLFNADGSPVKELRNGHNWKEPTAYLNQYRFASDEMYEIAETIIKHDPNSVVWLLSDHSARASSDPDLHRIKFPPEDMTNFFSAVYYNGQKLNIEGLSGVNTFRLILNELLGTSFEMLPSTAVGER